MRFVVTCILAALAGVSLAYAAPAPKIEFENHAWQVISALQEGKKMCYLHSTPQKSSGTFKKRGTAYTFVTHVSKGNDEVSVAAGYPFKQDAASITIDKAKFALFTRDSVAWAKDQSQDAAIVKAMMKGEAMIVKGTSLKDTTSQDTYSLKGFTGAYKWMIGHCHNAP
jgi:invasion protein IalB